MRAPDNPQTESDELTKTRLELTASPTNPIKIRTIGRAQDNKKPRLAGLFDGDHRSVAGHLIVTITSHLLKLSRRRNCSLRSNAVSLTALPRNRGRRHHFIE